MLYIKYELTSFYTSITDIKNLHNNQGIEIAFVGRSNAGKSSAINVITKNNIARTSKTPGNTKFINFFEVKKFFYFIDFPGYGYSKVSKLEKKKWELIIIDYINIRKCLKGLILIVDIRRGIQETDQLIVNCAFKNKIPILLLLTKSDKLTKFKRNYILEKNRIFFTSSLKKIQIETFSAIKLIGIENVRQKINSWYNIHNKY